jgi:hypothetical protein
LQHSRQRHSNKKYGGRGPLRVLNSVNCDCVTQVAFPARTFRFISLQPLCLKVHCGKLSPIQWVLVDLSLWVKRPEREADHSSAFMSSLNITL